TEIMKNLKTMLPILAFVLAVGMSFAFVDSSSNTGRFIQLSDGTPYELQTGVDCENDEQLLNNCEVIVENQDPQGPYQVYEDSGFTMPIKTNSITPIVILK